MDLKLSDTELESQEVDLIELTVKTQLLQFNSAKKELEEMRIKLDACKLAKEELEQALEVERRSVRENEVKFQVLFKNMSRLESERISLMEQVASSGPSIKCLTAERDSLSSSLRTVTLELGHAKRENERLQSQKSCLEAEQHSFRDMMTKSSQQLDQIKKQISLFEITETKIKKIFDSIRELCMKSVTREKIIHGNLRKAITSCDQLKIENTQLTARIEELLPHSNREIVKEEDHTEEKVATIDKVVLDKCLEQCREIQRSLDAQIDSYQGLDEVHQKLKQLFREVQEENSRLKKTRTELIETGTQTDKSDMDNHNEIEVKSGAESLNDSINDVCTYQKAE